MTALKFDKMCFPTLYKLRESCVGVGPNKRTCPSDWPLAISTLGCVPVTCPVNLYNAQ